MPILDLGSVKGPQGEPGYTPIKGVDYFDGKDGQDGKDGYTPVKGVDYFDGTPGQDGKDGKDGTEYHAGPGLYQEDNVIGVKAGPGFFIDPDGNLGTESYAIPHEGDSVGNQLNWLTNQLNGTTFRDLWNGMEPSWDVEKQIAQATLGINNPDLHDAIVNDQLEYMELSVQIGGDGWGRGFGAGFARQDHNGAIVYMATFEDFEFSYVSVDITNNRIEVGVNNTELFNMPIFFVDLRKIDTARFVQYLEVGNGLSMDVGDGGAYRFLRVNEDFLGNFVGDMINQRFENILNAEEVSV